MSPLMPLTLNRRDFLFYGGATLAGVTLGETGRRRLARADERAWQWRTRGVERWTTSVCRECAAGCGVRVRLVDDVPVKLEGSPLCPVSRGRLCAQGQAALEAYFDPDRLTGPARQVGRRDERRWESVTWEVAIEILAGHLRRTSASPSGAALAVGMEEHGPLADAWAGFWTAAGARVAWTLAPTAARFRVGLAALTGVDSHPAFDLEHATYVLSFRAPIVENWLSPVWTQRSYGRFRRQGSRPRGRLVHVDDRRSLTARAADEWLAVPAEQLTHLVYGLASVILRENRVDRSFLGEFAGNFVEFEREIVTRFTPDHVAARTGVPVVSLLRLARDLTASPHPLVAVAADADQDLIDACLALNALLGAFDRAGGISAWGRSTGEPRDVGSAGDALAEVAAGRSRPRVIAFRDASVLRALSAPRNLEPALEACDLVVSFSPYLDESAAAADLLMPVHTPLESWHAVIPAPADPWEKVACARPAVGPRLDTRDLPSILSIIAERLGGSVRAACAWTSSEDLVGAELDRLWRLRRGTPYSSSFEVDWVRQLETGGWWSSPAASREEFGARVIETGGWLDPFSLPGQIREALRARGGLAFRVPAEETAAQQSPGWPRELDPAAFASAGAQTDTGEERFPLRLVAFTPPTVNLAGSPNQPVLFELLGQPDSPPWRLWAELNPEAAQASSIEPGSLMRVESADGSVEAVAVFVEGMPADRVALSFVPLVRDGGRWARLLEDDARGLWARSGLRPGCRVRLRRA